MGIVLDDRDGMVFAQLVVGAMNELFVEGIVLNGSLTVFVVDRQTMSVSERMIDGVIELFTVLVRVDIMRVKMMFTIVVFEVFPSLNSRSMGVHEVLWCIASLGVMAMSMRIFNFTVDDLHLLRFLNMHTKTFDKMFGTVSWSLKSIIRSLIAAVKVLDTVAKACFFRVVFLYIKVVMTGFLIMMALLSFSQEMMKIRVVSFILNSAMIIIFLVTTVVLFGLVVTILVMCKMRSWDLL